MAKVFVAVLDDMSVVSVLNVMPYFMYTLIERVEKRDANMFVNECNVLDIAIRKRFSDMLTLHDLVFV